MYHRPRLARLLTFVLICLATTLSPAFSADQLKQDMTAAVKAVRPALIRIIVVSADYRQGREVKMESAGSGVIISSKGYAVTNHHVAGNARRLLCTLADRRVVDAKLVGTDPLSDIAVIKLISPDGKPFPAASFGDSSKLQVGDRVFAMGCPYALSQSVTSGIISNTELIMPPVFDNSEFMLEGEDVGSIVRWIGHDAMIKPGNSGGPLVDREGKIVGINEISIGLSGAIPSNLATSVVDSLIRSGKVTRAWLGLEVQPLLRSSDMLKGILISAVMKDSPAQKAGLKPGDVLLNLNGTDVVARFKEQVPLFNQFAAGLPIGKPIEAKLLRDGKELTLSVTATERVKAADRQYELKSWGICATNTTYRIRDEMRLATSDGVVVTGVLPSGAAGAAKPAINEGDVIVRVGGSPVKGIADLRAVTRKLTAKATDQVPIIVDYLRGETHLATVVKIGASESTNEGAEINKAWLPIDSQVLTHELADALGVPGKTGVRVTRVYAHSTAEKAGLKIGDLIIKLDGEDIAAEQVEDEEVLPSLIRQYDVGAEAKLGIVRDGKPMDVLVKLEASPKPARDYPTYDDPNFEFAARDIAFHDKADGNVAEGAAGAYVESVSEGSWTALAGLRFGDVITTVNAHKVSGLDDLKTIFTEIAKSKPKSVVFKVLRGTHTLFLEVEPDWSEAGQ